VLVLSIVSASARQAWPPFILVTGLLLIGQVVSAEGLFEAAGARLARTPLSPRGLLVALLALVAVVTAVLNLDTSVVFLTPVLVHAARRRGLDERPFLYGAVFMSNAASLLLPGSNLTNVLVLSREHVTGIEFASAMLPAWLAACLLTTAVLGVVFPLRDGRPDGREPPPFRFGLGAACALIAASLVLALPNPALPVLAIGSGAAALRRPRPEFDVRALALLFALTVALGTLARAWRGPAELLLQAGRWPTAGLGALGAILVNNLPAAVVFSPQPPLHVHALLLGLNLGPDLAVTGSLSAYLWLQAARSVCAQASIRTYSLLGLVLMPLTLAGALAALVPFASDGG
jgi:arsenical pump membrane protein